MENDAIQLILNKLNAIETKIDIIMNKLDKCETSCKTMDDHINFVEDIYSTLRYPLDFIKSHINYMSGHTNDGSLPQIKDKI